MILTFKKLSWFLIIKYIYICDIDDAYTLNKMKIIDGSLQISFFCSPWSDIWIGTQNWFTNNT